MSGLREKTVGSKGYGNTAKSPMQISPTRNPQGLIDRVWRYLFGKKGSEWSSADEAQDEAARQRVMQQERERGFR